jgi:hypothetical protein
LAKLPEPSARSSADERGAAPRPPAAPLNPLLSKVELELPDGRYLLAYRQVEAAAPDV